MILKVWMLITIRIKEGVWTFKISPCYRNTFKNSDIPWYGHVYVPGMMWVKLDENGLSRDDREKSYQLLRHLANGRWKSANFINGRLSRPLMNLKTEITIISQPMVNSPGSYWDAYLEASSSKSTSYDRKIHSDKIAKYYWPLHYLLRRE